MTKIKNLSFTEKEMTIFISNGCTLSIPLKWFPHLVNANQSALKNWELSAAGNGIYLKDLDEDISLNGLLNELSWLLGEENVEPLKKSYSKDNLPENLYEEIINAKVDFKFSYLNDLLDE